jgi:hypothetical protein
MQFVLSLKMSGAAFDDPAAETARLLREAAEQVDAAGAVVGTRAVLMDVNGNRCGGWEVIKG